MADSPTSPPQRKPSKHVIEGIPLVDPTKLPDEFRRFRNDDLYFIGMCNFHPPNNGKVCPRVVALTPVAFFVTDLTGKMDRATRYELIEGGYVQTIVKKKMILGTDETFHIVLKIPKEIDCHFSFEKAKDFSEAKKFVATMEQIVQHKRKNSTFKFDQVETEKKIDELITEKAATGYVSPQEILRQNKDRQRLVQSVEECNQECANNQSQIEKLYRTTSEKKQQLTALESANVGMNLQELRMTKEVYQQRQVMTHKSHTLLEIEIMKLKSDCRRLVEQLAEEKSNYELIVKNRLDKAETSSSTQQNEMMQLRQKAQKREIDKATSKLSEITAALQVLPKYTDAPENLLQRSFTLEAQVTVSVEKWQKEMESVHKVEKFIDAMNAEIDRIGRHVQDKHSVKMQLLQEYDAIVTAIQHRQESEKRAQEESEKRAQEESEKRAHEEAARQQQQLHSANDGKMVEAPMSTMDDLLGDGPIVVALAQHHDPMNDLLGGTDLLGGEPNTMSNHPLDDDLLGGGGGGLDDLLGDGPSTAPQPEVNADDLI